MGYALFIDHRNALALRSECKYEKEDARALFEDEYESYATQAWPPRTHEHVYTSRDERRTRKRSDARLNEEAGRAIRWEREAGGAVDALRRGQRILVAEERVNRKSIMRWRGGLTSDLGVSFTTSGVFESKA
jgi:hypothetical protein